MRNRNTATIDGSEQFTGLCLDKEDLCVAKLCAYREKDLEFVGALADAGLVDLSVVGSRLHEVPAVWASQVNQALRWVATRS